MSEPGMVVNDRTLRLTDRTLRLTIEGLETITRDLEPTGDHPGPGHHARPLGLSRSDIAEGRQRLEVIIDGWRFEVVIESASRARLRERATRGDRASSHASCERIRARIPGRVVRVWAAVGDIVGAGQRLLAIEAMKMENEIRATRGGKVVSMQVAAGQTVELGDELAVVDHG